MSHLTTSPFGFGGIVKNFRKVFGTKSRIEKPPTIATDSNWVVEGGTVAKNAYADGIESQTVLDSWESNEIYQQAIDDICTGNNSCAIRKRGSIKEKCARRWQSLTNLFEGKSRKKPQCQDEEFGEEDMRCSLEGLSDIEDNGVINNNSCIATGDIAPATLANRSIPSETSSEESIEFYARINTSKTDRLSSLSSSSEDEDAPENEDTELIQTEQQNTNKYNDDNGSLSSITSSEEEVDVECFEDVTSEVQGNSSVNHDSGECAGEYEDESDGSCESVDTSSSESKDESDVDTEDELMESNATPEDVIQESKITEETMLQESVQCQSKPQIEDKEAMLQEIAQAKRVNTLRTMWQTKEKEESLAPKSFTCNTFLKKKKWGEINTIRNIKHEESKVKDIAESVETVPEDKKSVATKKIGIFAKIEKFEQEIEEEEISEEEFPVPSQNLKNSNKNNSTTIFTKRTRKMIAKEKPTWKPHQPIAYDRETNIDRNMCEEPPKRSVFAMASFLQSKDESAREDDDFTANYRPIRDVTTSSKPKKHKYEEDIKMDDDFIAKLMSSSFIGDEESKETSDPKKEETLGEKPRSEEKVEPGMKEVTDEFFKRTMKSSIIPEEVKKRLLDEFWTLFNDSKISASIKQPILNKLIADYEVT